MKIYGLHEWIREYNATKDPKRKARIFGVLKWLLRRLNIFKDNNFKRNIYPN